MNVLFYPLPLHDLQKLVFQVSAMDPLQKKSVQQDDVSQISNDEKLFGKHDGNMAFVFDSCIN